MRKLVLMLLITVLLSQSILPVEAQLVLRVPETPLADVIASMQPPTLVGLAPDPLSPLTMKFLVEHPSSSSGKSADSTECKKLIRYFLAAMTIPDDEQWVNLSPYEPDRMIPPMFGRTEMGQDLLAQDYQLKQFTGALMSPDGTVGKMFWAQVYEKLAETYGTTDVPVEMLSKVWLVPDQAVVVERHRAALVTRIHLKVLMEKDYLAATRAPVPDPAPDKMNAIAAQVFRRIVIPEIEKEVNEGGRFAGLRQLVRAMVLATWYKRRLKNSLLTRAYADKELVAGIDEDPERTTKIYDSYLQAFRAGALNTIRDDHEALTGDVVPRQYFSGGLAWAAAQRAATIRVYDAATNPSTDDVKDIRSLDQAADSGRVTSITVEVQASLPRSIKLVIEKWNVPYAVLCQQAGIDVRRFEEDFFTELVFSIKTFLAYHPKIIYRRGEPLIDQLEENKYYQGLAFERLVKEFFMIKKADHSLGRRIFVRAGFGDKSVPEEDRKYVQHYVVEPMIRKYLKGEIRARGFKDFLRYKLEYKVIQILKTTVIPQFLCYSVVPPIAVGLNCYLGINISFLDVLVSGLFVFTTGQFITAILGDIFYVMAFTKWFSSTAEKKIEAKLSRRLENEILGQTAAGQRSTERRYKEILFEVEDYFRSQENEISSSESERAAATPGDSLSQRTESSSEERVVVKRQFFYRQATKAKKTILRRIKEQCLFRAFHDQVFDLLESGRINKSTAEKLAAILQFAKEERFQIRLEDLVFLVFVDAAYGNNDLDGFRDLRVQRRFTKIHTWVVAMKQWEESFNIVSLQGRIIRTTELDKHIPPKKERLRALFNAMKTGETPWSQEQLRDVLMARYFFNRIAQLAEIGKPYVHGTGISLEQALARVDESEMVIKCLDEMLNSPQILQMFDLPKDVVSRMKTEMLGVRKQANRQIHDVWAFWQFATVRNIGSLLSRERPGSIVVFGPPYAGKSQSARVAMSIIGKEPTLLHLYRDVMRVNPRNPLSNEQREQVMDYITNDSFHRDFEAAIEEAKNGDKVLMVDGLDTRFSKKAAARVFEEAARCEQAGVSVVVILHAGGKSEETFFAEIRKESQQSAEIFVTLVNRQQVFEFEADDIDRFLKAWNYGDKERTFFRKVAGSLSAAYLSFFQDRLENIQDGSFEKKVREAVMNVYESFKWTTVTDPESARLLGEIVNQRIDFHTLSERQKLMVVSSGLIDLRGTVVPLVRYVLSKTKEQLIRTPAVMMVRELEQLVPGLIGSQEREIESNPPFGQLELFPSDGGSSKPNSNVDNAAVASAKGGIDLDPAPLHLQVEEDPDSAAASLPGGNFVMVNGLFPEITKVELLTHLP